MLCSSIQNAYSAAACNLEEDVGVIISDLLISDSCTWRRVGKVHRVADHEVNARINLLRAVLVPGDIANDWWDRKAPDCANGVMAQQLRHLRLAVHFHLTGNRANQAACLLLFEEQRGHIWKVHAVAAGRSCSAAVNQGKHLIGELLGNPVHWSPHQEP